MHYVVYTQIHNVAGTPAMSAPLGMSHDGLPIRSQFAAAKGREDLLYALAYELKPRNPGRRARRKSGCMTPAAPTGACPLLPYKRLSTHLTRELEPMPVIVAFGDFNTWGYDPATGGRFPRAAALAQRLAARARAGL